MDTFIEYIGIFFISLILAIIISIIVIFTVGTACDYYAKEDAKNIMSVETVINNEKITLTNIEKIYCDDTSIIYTKDGKVYSVKEYKVNYIK